MALTSELTVILDASFLSRARRQALVEVARNFRQETNSPVPAPVFLYCTATEEVLRSRVVQRKHEGTDCSDADLEVLKNQVLDPFTDDELFVQIATDGADERKNELLQDLSRRVKHYIESDGRSGD
jgi:predicted kinase